MIRIVKNKPHGRKYTGDPVKLTALLYLREALLKERYEDCKDIIEVAKEAGATDREVRLILEDPKRPPG